MWSPFSYENNIENIEQENGIVNNIINNKKVVSPKSYGIPE